MKHKYKQYVIGTFGEFNNTGELLNYANKYNHTIVSIGYDKYGYVKSVIIDEATNDE